MRISEINLNLIILKSKTSRKGRVLINSIMYHIRVHTLYKANLLFVQLLRLDARELLRSDNVTVWQWHVLKVLFFSVRFS